MDQIKILEATTPKLDYIADKTKINVRYSLLPPFANAHIYWDANRSEVVYDVEEPTLDAYEKEKLSKIISAVQEIININIKKDDAGSFEDYLDKIIKLIISELQIEISEESYSKIFYFLYRDFYGLNLIEPLMRDKFIEDIQCNGLNQPIYLVHRVYRNLRTNLKFENLDELASFVEKLAQKCGRYVSYASPILDGSLPDGSRVNATYTKDISSRGPTFTIRKFTKTPLTPINLVAMKTLSLEMLAFLWIAMQYKVNVLISGGTGSGKTTLLNCVGFFIPPEARVVSIEDTRELNLFRENWLPSVVRTGLNLGGVGEVDMFSLLKASFRQIPDYVIVGEVRGKEAAVLFQGMASGHTSMATIHADSVETIIRRLQTPPIELSPSLVNELDIVAIMAHAVVNSKETRKLREIVEVVDVSSDGTAKTNTPFMWDPAQDRFYFKKNSHVFEKIQKKFGIPPEKLYQELDRRTKLLYEIYKRNISTPEEFQKIVGEFYKNPEAVYAKFGVN